MRERCYHERNTCTWQQMTFRKIGVPSRQVGTTFPSLRPSLVSCYNSRCNTPSVHKIITVIIIASVKLPLLILFAFCAQHRMTLVPKCLQVFERLLHDSSSNDAPCHAWLCHFASSMIYSSMKLMRLSHSAEKNSMSVHARCPTHLSLRPDSNRLIDGKRRSENARKRNSGFNGLNCQCRLP